MRDSQPLTTSDMLTRHLHSALRDAEDPEVRYHIRHVLQYVEAERSPTPHTDRAAVDGR